MNNCITAQNQNIFEVFIDPKFIKKLITLQATTNIIILLELRASYEAE
jgi:hypothetical protein